MIDMPIESICTKISSGGTPSRNHPEYYCRYGEEGHLWVKSKELLDVSINDTEEKITEIGLNKSSAKLYPPHTVLIAMYGANVGQLGWLKRTATVNQAICGLVVNSNVADWRYVFYSLLYKRAELINKAQGAAQQNINQDIIKQLKIPLPELSSQYKIASILSAYDDLIENNTRRIKILEEMAQNIYREWFVRFRFPGHEKVRMVESELGMIPEGWKINNIGSLISHTIGGGWGEESQSVKFSKPAYVIRGTDMPNARHGSIESCPLRYHTESNLRSRRLEAGDIVFEVSGGSKGQPVGRALLINQNLLDSFDNDVICASFCKLIRLDKNIIIPELIYLHLLGIYANGVIEKYQVQSTGISNFKYEFFLQSEMILVPEKDVQQIFADNITPIFDLIQKLGAKNANLRRTRDLLLPKLISGELDVENLDIDTGGAE